MSGGSGRGGGGGRGSATGGGGRNGGGGFGSGGNCVCAKCGRSLPHARGVKCTSVKCPDCGHAMVREELLNNKAKTGDQS